MKQAKSQQKQIVCDPLTQRARSSQVQRREAEGELGGDGAVNGGGFSFARRKSPGALLHNNVNKLNTTVHSKVIKMVNFMLGFLPQ